MAGLDLFGLRERFRQDRLLICFAGPFHHGLIEEIGAALRKYLESEDARPGAAMSVFAVFVEQAQNVRNYILTKTEAGATPPQLDFAIVVIGRSEAGAYQVCSGNLILDADLPALTAYVDRLNGMDRVGLRGLYKEIIRQPLDPNARGAGLGLIDMARKASVPMEYEIAAAGEGVSFFSLTVTI